MIERWNPPIGCVDHGSLSALIMMSANIWTRNATIAEARKEKKAAGPRVDTEATRSMIKRWAQETVEGPREPENIGHHRRGM
jgi:hypothetical protein